MGGGSAAAAEAGLRPRPGASIPGTARMLSGVVARCSVCLLESVGIGVVERCELLVSGLGGGLRGRGHAPSGCCTTRFAARSVPSIGCPAAVGAAAGGGAGGEAVGCDAVGAEARPGAIRGVVGPWPRCPRPLPPRRPLPLRPRPLKSATNLKFIRCGGSAPASGAQLAPGPARLLDRSLHCGVLQSCTESTVDPNSQNRGRLAAGRAAPLLATTNT